MTEKLIFSDVDEVLLKWLPPFSKKMVQKGYNVINPTEYFLHHHFDIEECDVADIILDFNQSRDFANLEPVDDSVYFAKQIAEELGYKFILISAAGESGPGHPTYDYRLENVSKIIGEENIKDLIMVTKSSDKYQHLEKHSGKRYIWVEDNIKNAEMGAELGYKSLLYRTPWNAHYKGDANVEVINSWRDVYKKCLLTVR